MFLIGKADQVDFGSIESGIAYAITHIAIKGTMSERQGVVNLF